MAATEFEIVVSDRKITGSFGRVARPPSETPEADLTFDELTKDTVDLMDRWLNFYSLIIGRAEIRHRETLFEGKTFEVVGQQLWRLILDNEVGRSLVMHLDNPDDQPLRLVLTFTNAADADLRGLPWEFLHHPRHGFLAGKTGLLLTRYVYHEEDGGRPTVTPVHHDQLRVLLLAALPDERRFAAEREDLDRLWRSLKAIDQLDPLEPIPFWDADMVSTALSSPDKPCHIVHVLGICRGAPGRPRLFLGGGIDGFEDPQQLVDRLTGSVIPQLVILQLCDYQDGDASENFERLAPDLVEKGVPAVLALQYAAPADEVGVGVDFYRSLINGSAVGAAVQASRGNLARKVDRRLGTPVLYLGNDGALWGSAAPRSSALSKPAGAPLHRPAGPPGDSEVKTRLAGVILRNAELDTHQRNELLAWAGGLRLDGDPTATARDLIQLRVKGPVDDVTREVARQMLDELRPEQPA